MRVLRAMDEQAFRLFAPVYLLVLGATLTILPVGELSANLGGRAAFGMATFVSGLILLVLGGSPLGLRRSIGVYGAIAALQAGYGLFVLVSDGAWVAASIHLLFAAGIVMLAGGGAKPRMRRAVRPDLLVLVLATVNAVHGLAVMLRADGAAKLLDMVNVSPEAWGLAMLVSSLGIVVLQLRPGGPPWAEWASAIFSGGLLLSIQVLAALRVDSLYWLLGVSVYLRAGALMLQPAWQPRLPRIPRRSLQTKIAAAVVTAASLPLFMAVVIQLYGPDDLPESLPTRQLGFGILSIILVVTYGLGWGWGAAISEAHRRVASALEDLSPGRPWRWGGRRLDAELQTIARTVERLSSRLSDEKVAAERRSSIARAAEAALSSSLELNVAAERLMEALVPAFCDSAVVYVREGDETRRLALRLPANVPPSAHVQATGAGVGPDAVLRTGQPQLYLDGLPDGYYARLAADRDHERTIRTMRISSLMLVPIASSHGVLGVLSAALHGGRRFSPLDAAALQEVAGRAALCIENARLYERLREANAVKDEFLGLVSHELKTPITTILGNAVLLPRARSEEARSQLEADLASDAERLAAIVDNLLALARIELVEAADVEPLALHLVVGRCVAELARTNPGREITADIAGPAIVEASAAQIEMVIRNLVGNALKYSPGDAPVNVELRLEEGRVRIAVLDRGPGFGDADPNDLFKAFYRAQGAGSKAGGLGIGLAVCRRIAEALGGDVFANRRPGGGSTFGLWLPLARLATEAEELPQPARTGSLPGSSGPAG